MKVRALLPALVALVVLLLPAAAHGAQPAFNIASDSYYQLDVPNGAIKVRVEAEVQAAGTGQLTTVTLWAMPGAANIAVTADGAALEAKPASTNKEPGMPSVFTVALPKPLRGGLTQKLQLTYDVPTQKNDFVRLAKGTVEALFVSQGPGSFVFIDLPKAGDNYLDPGCLKVRKQPVDVAEGFERWVCGEVLAAAMSVDDQSVLDRCADLDDRCRQRYIELPISAFAQSITDPALQGHAEANVQLGDRTVKLVLRFFKSDQKWADRELAVATQAFPKLEALFGFPYPYDTVTLRQSHHIGFAGAAGVAFPDQGEVLLETDTGFDDEVTVHELAHQWAGSNLETSWLWEGLADWASHTLAPELGIKPYDRKWTSFKYKDPLATWYNGSGVTNPDYWYGKSAAFWSAYEKAIGGRDNMRAVLAQLGAKPKHPRDGRWFMDRGEEVSGANLDALFLEWVWQPELSKPLLAERRAAHDLVKQLQAKASQYGLEGLPVDLQGNLDEWTFGQVAAQTAKAGQVVDNYVAVLAEGTAAGLPGVPGGVAAGWKKGTIADANASVENLRQAIHAITNTEKQLGERPLGDPARTLLVKAREAYSEGKLEEAEQLAADAVTYVANYSSAQKMIAIAKEKQAAFDAGFFARIGMYFTDPASDLAQAQAEFDAGHPEKALRLASNAYDTWDKASQHGIQRLAILMGAMSAITLGTWYILRRLDPDRRQKHKPGQGHYIETGEGRSRWRDWENTRG